MKYNDRGIVTAADQDGSLTIRRENSRWRITLTLPAAYVAENVELGYAITAHRSQGATVDTAQAVEVTEENAARSRLSRRRRDNTPAGSKKRRDVWVIVEEEAALVARAEREKVTVPNLLISSASSVHSDSPTERRAIAAELMSLHNLLACSSTTSTSSPGRRTPRAIPGPGARGTEAHPVCCYADR